MSYEDLQSRYGFVPMNHKAPVFFPVWSRKLFDEKGQEVPGWQRIARGDSGDTLHIATSSYTMVPYEFHFGLFEEAIRKSVLNKEGMMVGTDMADNGARIFRQYLFPEESANIVDRLGHTNRLSLRIAMWDSYNGQSRFIGKGGYFNFFCANQGMSGKSIIDVSFKHTGAMEARIEKAANAIVGGAEAFILEMRRMEAWPHLDLKVSEFSDLLAELPQHNPRLINELTAEYGRGDDHSLWGANQLLTNWATHDLHKSTLPGAVKNNRQARVATLAESVTWHEIEKRDPVVLQLSKSAA